MKLKVTEDVTVTYIVEIPDSVAEGGDEEQIEACIAANQPPRSEWYEAVNERSWEER